MPQLRCITLAVATVTLAVLSAASQQIKSVQPKANVSDSLPPGAIERLGTTWFNAVGWDVAAVACSPDCKQLAQISVLGVVSLWDIATGIELRRYCTFERFLRE